MSLAAVVRKEFHSAVRSRTLHAVTLLFGLFVGGLAALRFVPPIFRAEATAPPSTLALLNSMKQPTMLFVPLVGLALGYAAVVGERERGSHRLLLGLPNTRLEVLVGKFLGRTAVVAVAVLATYSLAAVLALATYDRFDVVAFASYALLSLWLAAVYVAIGTALSARASSQPAALAGAAGLYGLFMVGWDLAMVGLQYATVGEELPPGGLPEWITFVAMVNPSTAFSEAASAVVPGHDQLTRFPEPDAVFLQHWVGFPLLALWVVLPLAAGYRAFARGDL